MLPETGRTTDTPAPPALNRYRCFFIFLGALAAIITAVLLLLWPFGLTAREKTAEQWIMEGLEAFKKQDFFLADRAFKEA
ncbi:MAG TPA: hypothetical protein EYP63_08325, partial [Desulfotomaculum sp.]|nr:hypothetical protein [Desulfotomaculum sp.]